MATIVSAECTGDHMNIIKIFTRRNKTFLRSYLHPNLNNNLSASAKDLT